MSPKKTCDYILYNNFNNRCPIAIIFSIVSSKAENADISTLRLQLKAPLWMTPSEFGDTDYFPDN